LRILALETTGTTGTLALLQADRLVARRALDPHRRSARSLAQGIAAALGSAGWRAADLQLVAVAAGPGSFTGLRVGVTTAKVLAYAVGAEVLGVSTLETIAQQAPPDVAALHVVMDAHRGLLFAGRFARAAEGTMVPQRPPAVLEAGAWLAELVPRDTVSGPMVRRLEQRLPAGVRATPEATWAPDAVTVGRLAWQKHVAGRRDDLWRLAPDYVRASAAEEQRGRGGEAL
jgi:tRNA threonylcarbamoyladenosine biosynthesis protein TsaB